MSKEPEGGIHLLLADDTVSAGHRGRRYLTLCGELVTLVSASYLPECDREHVLCQECVNEGERLGRQRRQPFSSGRPVSAQVPADAGSVSGAPRPVAQPDPQRTSDDGRRNYLVDECGHPRLIRPNGRVSKCRLCDPRRPAVPDIRLPATELYSIDAMASVDTVSWWCRLCDREATATSAPAADTDAVEHIAAQHRAVVEPT